MVKYEVIIPRPHDQPFWEADLSYAEKQFFKAGISLRSAVRARVIIGDSALDAIPRISDKWYLSDECTDDQVCILALLTDAAITKLNLTKWAD